MQKENLLVAIEEIGWEVDSVASLLGVFERWFDEGFKTNEAQRTFSEDKSADLWNESTDYAAVFDVAMEKLFELNKVLKGLDKEEENAA